MRVRIVSATMRATQSFTAAKAASFVPTLASPSSCTRRRHVRHVVRARPVATIDAAEGSPSSSRRTVMMTGLTIGGAFLITNGEGTTLQPAQAFDNPLILGNGYKRIYGEATTAARYLDINLINEFNSFVFFIESDDEP